MVALATGRVVGHELLVRFVDSDWTLIGPDYFLEVAERTGLVAEVDSWVLGRAGELAGVGHHVHVNVSARTLADRPLAAEIEDVLERHNADPSRLTVEISETAVTEEPRSARALAERLTALGGRIALDDFGTGCGGLAHLKHLPCELVKIDIEFIHDVVSNPRSRAVVGALVRLASDLGLLTAAEGVEDEATYRALRDMGVTLAQGFHIARPIPVGKLRPVV
jgi:EAL domain-containing protein (putative c-di-GMP-specific phosphodiesterase class I)